jgi:hypothetical protein
MVNMGYLGYVECKACGTYTYINNPNQVKIWYHPDDSKSLAQVECSCGNVVENRISYEHMVNFRRRGCSIMEWNDRFMEKPLTEQNIDEWDIDAEFFSR